MVSGDLKDLLRRTASGKVLSDKDLKLLAIHSLTDINVDFHQLPKNPLINSLQGPLLTQGLDLFTTTNNWLMIYTNPSLENLKIARYTHFIHCLKSVQMIFLSVLSHIRTKYRDLLSKSRKSSKYPYSV